MGSKDPYRYFRIEAVELAGGLAEGLLALEREDQAEVMPRLRRHAHTLKGAARIVRRPEIADRAHRIEDLLEAEGVVDVDAALALVDEIRACVAELGLPGGEATAPKVEAAPAQAASELRVLRLDVSELDALLGDVVTARASTAELSRRLATLDGVRDDARALAAALTPGTTPPPASYVFESVERLAQALESMSRALLADERRLCTELDELTDRATTLRLVPAAALLGDLERAVRDAALQEGKTVRFVSRGAETRLDIQVLGGLRGALVHLVRNAVAHGIEAAEVRAAAGKAREGVVELSVEARGHRVAFTCRDDGAGVDVARVRGAAVARGLLASDATPGDDELLELAWQVGISTRSGVSDLAGRGVGLDVVRDAVAQVGGERSLRTRAGGGTDIELVVPTSLSAMPALEVASDGEPSLIPLDAIRHALLVEPDAVTSTPNGSSIVSDGELLPFVALGRALRRREGASGPRAAVIVEAAGRRAAVGVDSLGRVHNVVVRALPAAAAADAVVAGAAFDQGGAPRLVLAPPALVEAATGPAARPAVAPAARRIRVLVVDDSLTTRMLEQSILEAAGYDVSLAVSAEDALELLAETRFDLFLVDVEMPGMNGYDFVAATKRDPALRDVPAILVTSRDSDEDVERGLAAGASAYLVKSLFDQRRLLELIEELVQP